jgi:hypothetical protein
LTAAKGSPSSQTVTEHHRLLDPSMNMTGCSIHRWMPPTAWSVHERDQLLYLSLNTPDCPHLLPLPRAVCPDYI